MSALEKSKMDPSRREGNWREDTSVLYMQYAIWI